MLRDFLYFSKGERRGLVVLLCLIAVAGILLTVNNRKDGEETIEENKSLITNDKDTLKNVMSADLSVNNKPNTAIKPASKQAAEQKSLPPKKESVSERVERLASSSSRPSYPRAEKFDAGTVVELNAADTVTLKKIPGIGSSFAKRIVGYRALLGGYYSVDQLSEVYGIDEEKYAALAPWFTADPSLISQLSVNSLPLDSLRRHPYIDGRQARVIVQLRKQKGKISGWENLQLLDEFTDLDAIRLKFYLSYE
ncbi:MAG: helix-hairpin-helix domain-containing protein [Tannerella sp.]|jgi:DNA uptake protein ComE-like DNA-binding protein|nr:helix-hairpin-helix domain-containing protein [Tannerella sp.]